jgi:hypothetical protein
MWIAGSCSSPPLLNTLPAFDDSPQWFGRIDHYSSTKHRFSIRYLYDSRQTVPESVSFPGFVQQDAFSPEFTHTHLAREWSFTSNSARVGPRRFWM